MLPRRPGFCAVPKPWWSSLPAGPPTPEARLPDLLEAVDALEQALAEEAPGP
jgi:hypothetical protein